MNNLTLSHNNLFDSKEAYCAFTLRWKALAHAKALTAADRLLRCILLKQNVSRALPVTDNERRLANGAALNSGLVHAQAALRRVGDPAAVSLARVARIEAIKAAGRQRVPEFLLEPLWHDKWVDVAQPLCTANGLSVASLASACQRASA